MEGAEGWGGRGDGGGGVVCVVGVAGSGGGGGTKCHLVRFNLRPTVFSFQASQVSRDSDSDLHLY